jgi:hypothetical protein
MLEILEISYSFTDVRSSLFLIASQLHRLKRLECSRRHLLLLSQEIVYFLAFCCPSMEIGFNSSPRNLWINQLSSHCVHCDVTMALNGSIAFALWLLKFMAEDHSKFESCRVRLFLDEIRKTDDGYHQFVALKRYEKVHKSLVLILLTRAVGA